MAEELAREDAEPLEQPVAGAMAMAAVQGRQIVDIEQDDDDPVAVTQGPDGLLREHEIEQRRRQQGGQLVAQGMDGAIGFGDDGRYLDSSDADAAGRDLPRFGVRADTLVERQLPDGGPFRMVDGPNQLAHIQMLGKPGEVLDRRRSGRRPSRISPSRSES